MDLKAFTNMNLQRKSFIIIYDKLTFKNAEIGLSTDFAKTSHVRIAYTILRVVLKLVNQKQPSLLHPFNWW